MANSLRAYYLEKSLTNTTSKLRTLDNNLIKKLSNSYKKLRKIKIFKNIISKFCNEFDKMDKLNKSLSLLEKILNKTNNDRSLLFNYVKPSSSDTTLIVNMARLRYCGARYNEPKNECTSRKYTSISLRTENIKGLPAFFLSLNIAELTGEHKWDYLKELCTMGRYFVSRVISEEYADNLPLSFIQLEENLESFIPLIGRLLNMNDENKVENLKIFSSSFIDIINKNKSKNNSNHNETLPSTRSSEIQGNQPKRLTVIDLQKKTAQTFKSHLEAAKSYPKGLSRGAIQRYVDKNRIFKNRFIFKNGFVESLTTYVGQSVALSKDQLEVYSNNDR